MGLFGDFWRYIQGKMLGGKTYEVSSQDLVGFLDTKKWKELALYEFALNAGINIIANVLSGCEVRVFENWQEKRNSEYYRWNFQPNVNMSSNQFMHKLIWTLIYKNECLVIPGAGGAGDLVIAENFTKEQTSIYNRIEFSNVTIRGAGGESYTFNRTFWSDDVFYYQLSNQNIVELLRMLVDEYNDLLQAAIQKFYKSGGERGTLTIDGNATAGNYGTKSDGSPRTFNDIYTELLNKQFADYFKSNNAVLPLFKGFSYETKGTESTKKSTSEIKDVTDITDEIYDKVANALQIPPALLKGDIADVGALTRNLITFAIKPIADIIETENNRKLYGEKVLQGNYQMIDTSSIMYISVSELAVAVDKMLGSGWTLDEIRKKTGDPVLHTEESQKRYITLNYAEMKTVGGSDPSGGGLDTKISGKGGSEGGEE